MGCNQSTSNLCTEDISSRCVDYDGPLGANTGITESCVDQYAVNEDLYNITDNIISDSDATVDLEKSNCLTYPLTDGVVLVKTALTVLDTAVCDHESRITILEGKDYSQLDITGFGLDFACLSDPCGDPITTLGQLLQIMINNQCTV
jgi:hypothetical protein